MTIFKDKNDRSDSRNKNIEYHKKFDERVWRKKRFDRQMSKRHNKKINEDLNELFVFITLLVLICFFTTLIIILRFGN